MKVMLVRQFYSFLSAEIREMLYLHCQVTRKVKPDDTCS